MTVSAAADRRAERWPAVLIAALTAPYAIALDAVSFVVSTAFMLRDPQAGDAAGTGGGRAEAADVAGAQGGRALCRSTTASSVDRGVCTGTSNFFGSTRLRDRPRCTSRARCTLSAFWSASSSPDSASAAIDRGAHGRRVCSERLGVGRGNDRSDARVASTSLASRVPARADSVPGAGSSSSARWSSASATIAYNITQVSLRQAIRPERLQGRMNASMRWIVWGTIPLGSLAGGAIATAYGLRTALWVGAIGALFTLPSGASLIRALDQGAAGAGGRPTSPNRVSAESSSRACRSGPASIDGSSALPSSRMPELPEMEAWRRQLTDPVSAFPIAKAGPAHIATLKTFDPPLAALEGRRLRGAERRGKRLLFPTDDGELVLLVHLMTAGRLKIAAGRRDRPEDARVRARVRRRLEARPHGEREEEARRRLAADARAGGGGARPPRA